MSRAATAGRVAADLASRSGAAVGAHGPATQGPPAIARLAGEGVHYVLGEAIARAAPMPHERKPGEPLYRPLRIYTLDPSLPLREGAVATVDVPYEPLQPGPVGALFEVETRDGSTGEAYRQADLDDRAVLMEDGYAPSPSDPRFHQQMVYAICSKVYAAFRTALGRIPGWSFGGPDTPARLLLRPHDGEHQNAYYEAAAGCGQLRFGYFPASAQSTEAGMRGGYVFTCLSHDVVVHEVTHALLDGMRARFLLPTNPDVVAFHEAFADLVAIFQHFSYPEVVLTAIRRCRGVLAQSQLLGQVARQFGHTTGRGGPLRSAIEEDPGHPRRYDAGLEPHALGTILVSAVFEAFSQVFTHKTEPLMRLATGGSGVLPPGELPHDLQLLLARRASKLAGQFLAICIRAIDYCPPTGMTFGDYLRALVTADHDLVPDDPWDYRGALIDAFRRRDIYPRSARHLSQDALLWRPPRLPLPPLEGLRFQDLRFSGDPAHAADRQELRRQAGVLGRYVSDPQHCGEFGLVAPGAAQLGADTVSLPVVESIRAARRAGPGGQVVFDLVAEVTQARHVAPSAAGPGFTFHGGATVILSPQGEVRYAIVKSLLGAGRVQRRHAYFATPGAARYWEVRGALMVPRADLLRRLHADRSG